MQMLLIFNSDNMSFLILTLIYSLAVIVPCTSVLARRLHDVGKSGWFQFISLIPLIGGIWLLILTVTEGDAGTNVYGMNPKDLEYASQEM